jgi:hypothetical protein
MANEFDEPAWHDFQAPQAPISVSPASERVTQLAEEELEELMRSGEREATIVREAKGGEV